MPYKTREQAIAIAASIGCPISAHKVEDGWNPCRTNEEYEESKRKTRKQFSEVLDLLASVMGEDAFSKYLESPEGARLLIKLSRSEFPDDFEKNNPEVPQKFEKSAENMQVCKVDTGLGLVFGWAQICKVNGEDYYDSDNQHMPEAVTLGDNESGWLGFMKTARVHKAMHDGKQVGDVVFAFPAFSDIMKSLGFEPIGKTGIIAAVQVSDKPTLQKFHSGEYTGFSVGGSAAWADEE